MTKKELIELLEKTLQEIPNQIDGVHRAWKYFSDLQHHDTQKIEVQRKLYDLTLYVELMNGDFTVLFHQFLSSSLIYERKYAMAKLYPLMNEGFKHLYGFVSKTGEVTIRQDSKWNDIESILPLMNAEEKLLYESLLNTLEQKASFSWWKEERNDEIHLNAAGIYDHRCKQDDEDRAIKDAMSFYEIMTKTTALCSKMASRLFIAEK